MNKLIEVFMQVKGWELIWLTFIMLVLIATIIGVLVSIGLWIKDKRLETNERTIL